MNILNFIWIQLLFRPLLNILISLYNTIGLENLGLSIIWLTIMTRIVLLPLSFQEDSRKQKEHDINVGLKKLKKAYGNNPSVLRAEQRKLLKQFRFRKWPILVTLAVQGLVLVILYQVFLGGVNLATIVDSLYSFISVPAEINTIFFWIDISQRSFILSALTGIVLGVNIWLQQKAAIEKGASPDLLYLIGFPIVTFFFLWYLPATKAVFILSSILFSNLLDAFRAFKVTTKEQDAFIAKEKARKHEEKTGFLPKLKDRF